MAKKCRIVEETFVPGASVSVVARRHDVNANLVFGWRQKYRQGKLVDRKMVAKAASPMPDPDTSAGQALVRVGVVDQDGVIRPSASADGDPASPSRGTGKATASPGVNRPVAGIIEIELPSGIKVRVDAGIEEAALRRVLAAVREAA